MKKANRQTMPFVLLLSVVLVIVVMGLLLPRAPSATPAAPAGFTETPTPTDTPVPPTDTPTPTATPVSPTDTPTPTPTPVPPTDTPTPTATPVSPTDTPTPTPTPVPPTDTPTPTATPAPPTDTPTPTATPVPPTSTPTPTPIPTDVPPPTGVPTEPPITPQPQPTATPTPIVRDPFIIKQVNLERARPGDIVVFTIEVINPNPVSLSNVVVMDALSPLVDYVSASVPRGTFSYSPSSRVWTLVIGTMSPNERLTFTITTRVNAQAQPPNTLLNTAILETSRGVTESNTTTTLIVPGQLPATGRR